MSSAEASVLRSSINVTLQSVVIALMEKLKALLRGLPGPETFAHLSLGQAVNEVRMATFWLHVLSTELRLADAVEDEPDAVAGSLAAVDVRSAKH